MLYKVLTPFTFDGRDRAVSDVIDVTEEVAAEFVAAGNLEAVTTDEIVAKEPAPAPAPAAIGDACTMPDGTTAGTMQDDGSGTGTLVCVASEAPAPAPAPESQVIAQADLDANPILATLGAVVGDTVTVTKAAA